MAGGSDGRGGGGLPGPASCSCPTLACGHQRERQAPGHHFLSDFAHRPTGERLPRQESAFRLGWIGTKRFAPYDASIAYDGGLDYQGAYGAIGPEGDPAAWRRLMASLYKAPILRAALAASFAAPLVSLTGYQPLFPPPVGRQRRRARPWPSKRPYPFGGTRSGC